MATDPIPTLVRVDAFTERGTFTRRVQGVWTDDERLEETATVRADFYRSLHDSGCRRVQLRTGVFVELPLFGWQEVER